MADTTPDDAAHPTNETKPQQSPPIITALDETGEKPTKKKLSFYLSFISLSLLVFIVSLDATALGVAIPPIAQELNATTLESFWASLSFLLAVAVIQPVYTSTSDVLGRMVPLYFSIFIFSIGCIVFAVAESMAVLILGRALQGLGAGGLDVLTDIILTDITTLKERPLYIGLFVVPIALGGICGPLVGAAFSEFVDWRWIGWVNLPVAALGAVLAFFFMKLKPIDRTFMEKLKRLDWIGMAIFVVGSTIFALPLSWAGAMYPWKSAQTLVPFIAGIFILVGFCFYQKRPAEPLFPPRIFANRVLQLSMFMSFLVGTMFYTVALYLPLFFQAVFLETPFQSAVSILPLASSVVGFTVIGAIVVETLRKYKWAIVVSWVFTVAGVALWELWRPDSSRGLQMGLQVLAGAGIGALFSILFIPMQAGVEHVDDQGLAVGISTSFRVFGGVIGLAICLSIFNSVFEKHIADVALPPEFEILRDPKEAIAYIPLLSTLPLEKEILDQIVEVYRKAMAADFYFMVATAAIGFITSFFLVDVTLEKEEFGRQGLQS